MNKAVAPVVTLAALSLAVLLAERGEVTVPVAGQTVTVGYHAGKYNTPFIQRLDALTVDEVIEELVSDWSLADNEGLAHPITAETIAALPTRFKQHVWAAIRDDQRPNS